MHILNNKIIFPHPSEATDDGILAIGGDLSLERLELAYRNGIFPWFEEGEIIVWWSPNPRMVLYPDELKVSKSMRKFIRDNHYRITFDKAFSDVVDNCQKINRKNQDGTWITSDMKIAYQNLHTKGIAHSVEIWEDDKLVGGLKWFLNIISFLSIYGFYY